VSPIPARSTRANCRASLTRPPTSHPPWRPSATSRSANAHQLADQRQDAWAAAARKRLDKERDTLTAIADRWDAAVSAFIGAWVEYAYASGGSETWLRNTTKISAAIRAQQPDLETLRAFATSLPGPTPAPQRPVLQPRP
jgi:hypothetical protein